MSQEADIFPRLIEKHQRFETLFSAARKERTFPAASYALDNSPTFLGAYGRYDYTDGSPASNADTLFDLASLTKVICTTCVSMRLWERHKLPLDAPVANWLPSFTSSEKQAITIADLLLHRSGLPPVIDPNRAREELFECPVSASKETVYSDVGFLVLQEILERVGEATLDELFDREVVAPLELSDICFCPPWPARSRCAPTLDSLQGEVHDPLARALGGVCAHAGLFGSAKSLAKWAEGLLAGQLVKPSTLALWSRRFDESSTRALGWDTYGHPNGMFGHMGYTGTSIWLELEPQWFALLLTNRTYPSDSSTAIREFRPKFLDLAMSAGL